MKGGKAKTSPERYAPAVSIVLCVQYLWSQSTVTGLRSLFFFSLSLCSFSHNALNVMTHSPKKCLIRFLFYFGPRVPPNPGEIERDLFLNVSESFEFHPAPPLPPPSPLSVSTGPWPVVVHLPTASGHLGFNRPPPLATVPLSLSVARCIFGNDPSASAANCSGCL